ncbi:MAG: CDP-alcohol phosphatidyltransferase family protein [Acidimicrobiales bacterium]
MNATRTEWRPFTIPNLMSLVRLACIPWFVWLLFSDDNRFGAALLLAALGASDWVDGWFARRFDQVSELGKLLDPTADRLMLLTAVIATWIDGSVPWWFALLTLVREALVSGAALLLGALGSERFDVTWWGKTGAFFLMFAYPLLLGGASDVGAANVLRALGWICAVPGLFIAWYAAIEYVPIAREALGRGRAERTRLRP